MNNGGQSSGIIKNRDTADNINNGGNLLALLIMGHFAGTINNWDTAGTINNWANFLAVLLVVVTLPVLLIAVSTMLVKRLFTIKHILTSGFFWLSCFLPSN